MARVSVIIVNYNAGACLTECVQSVLRAEREVQVLVSDNASSDNSIEALRAKVRDPRLEIVENGANLGFGAGNNAVLGRATGEFILFLNPDCVLSPGAIDEFKRAFEIFPDAGMAGPLIQNKDGSEQRGCRRMAPTPWTAFVQAFGLHRMLPGMRSFNLTGSPLPHEPVEIEAISGACMFVRKAAIDKIGPLDEGYFMHCEDLDWCLRFRNGGYRVVFVPGVRVEHLQGVSSKSRPVRVEWYKHYGMIRYYAKFFGKTPWVLILPAVIFAVLARFALIAAKSFLGRALRKDHA